MKHQQYRYRGDLHRVAGCSTIARHPTWQRFDECVTQQRSLNVPVDTVCLILKLIVSFLNFRSGKFEHSSISLNIFRFRNYHVLCNHFLYLNKLLRLLSVQLSLIFKFYSLVCIKEDISWNIFTNFTSINWFTVSFQSMYISTKKEKNVKVD